MPLVPRPPFCPTIREMIEQLELRYEIVVGRYFYDDVSDTQQRNLQEAAASLGNAIAMLRAVEVEWLKERTEDGKDTLPRRG